MGLTLTFSDATAMYMFTCYTFPIILYSLLQMKLPGKISLPVMRFYRNRTQQPRMRHLGLTAAWGSPMVVLINFQCGGVRVNIWGPRSYVKSIELGFVNKNIDKNSIFWVIESEERKTVQ